MIESLVCSIRSHQICLYVGDIWFLFKVKLIQYPEGSSTVAFCIWQEWSCIFRQEKIEWGKIDLSCQFNMSLSECGGGNEWKCGWQRWSGDLILFVDETRLALSDFKQCKQHRRHKQVEREKSENPSISLKSFFLPHISNGNVENFLWIVFVYFLSQFNPLYSMFHSHLHNKSEHPTTSRELMNN